MEGGEDRASVRVLGERGEQERVDLGRNLRVGSRGPDAPRGLVPVHRGDLCRDTDEDRLSRQELEGERGEVVDVAARRRGRAGELLRAHERDAGVARVVLADADVEQPQRHTRGSGGRQQGEEDVAGLETAEAQAARVELVERGADLDEQFPRVRP